MYVVLLLYVLVVLLLCVCWLFCLMCACCFALMSVGCFAVVCRLFCTYAKDGNKYGVTPVLFLFIALSDDDMEPQVDALILIDRDVDKVSPLCTQLTYEGLIDEVFGINHGIYFCVHALQEETSTVYIL